MDFRIEEESIDVLAEYGQVPIVFEVKKPLSRRTRRRWLGGIQLIEEPVDPPYIKDYDHSGGPERWTRRTWDLSRWIIVAAYREQERIGGALVAFHSEGLDYCEGREDLAGLWDIRVRPEYQGRGVGRALFQRAETCAKKRGCTQLKIETQNINVPACRFYARMGAKLGQVHLYAYHTEGLDEVQLTWYKDL